MNKSQQLAFAFVSQEPARACDSVAEERLQTALVRSGWRQPIRSANDNDRSRCVLINAGFPGVQCHQQLQLELIIGVRFRADFVFRDVVTGRGLVVEIDGAKYHSSQVQVVRDKSIDRAVNDVLGWSIRRYPANDVLKGRRATRVLGEVHRVLRAARFGQVG